MGGIGGFPAGDFNLSNVQHLPASWIYAILDQARKDIEDQGIALKSGPLTDAILEEMVGVALMETAGGGGDDGMVDLFAESAAAKGPFQFTPQTWIEVSGNSDDPTWPGPNLTRPDPARPQPTFQRLGPFTFAKIFFWRLRPELLYKYIAQKQR